MKKTFTTPFNAQWFDVEYNLYPDGRKELQSITYDDLPIDIALLFGSEQHEELYQHVIDAMNNNAKSEKIVLVGKPPEWDNLFNIIGSICKNHANLNYGIKL